MIARLVSFALTQRFVIVMAALALMVWGAMSFQKLPIDAYPDLSPPHVEIITQWPGHAAEEVERLVTIPLEVEMNGIPQTGFAALDFAVRPVVDRDEFRVRRRPVLRPRAGVRAHGERDDARRTQPRASRRCSAPAA